MGRPCQNQKPECEKAGREIVLANAATTALDGRILQLGSNTLYPGTYKFTLTVTEVASGLQGSSTMSVVVNRPPFGGVVSVVPRSGVELLDTFVVKASGWRDVDVPLFYQFGFQDKDGLYMPITPVQTSYVADSPLPSSIASLRVRVYDAYEASNNGFAAVNVTALSNAGFSLAQISELVQLQLAHARELMESEDAAQVLSFLSILVGVLNGNTWAALGGSKEELDQRRAEREE
eukprot:1826013-Pyramimonas_sp.AAC.1